MARPTIQVILPVFRKMKFRAATAGHKIVMPDNRYLSLEELEIGDGVMLIGPTAIDDQGSDIRITKPPKIRGNLSSRKSRLALPQPTTRARSNERSRRVHRHRQTQRDRTD